MHELQIKYKDIIESLAKAACKCGELGFTASHGGNLSVKSDNLIFITPTKVPKDEITPEDIVIVDDHNKILYAKPGRKPTGELPMHSHIYNLRPDLHSIVHAHPPFLTGFSIARSKILARPLLPEPCIELGPILSIPYVEPVSEDLARAFEQVVDYSNAWLMENHGITVASAEGISRTFGLLQMAEAMAQSVSVALACSGIQEISEQEIEKLEKVLLGRNLPIPGNPTKVKSLTSLYKKDLIHAS